MRILGDINRLVHQILFVHAPVHPRIWCLVRRKLERTYDALQDIYYDTALLPRLTMLLAPQQTLVMSCVGLMMHMHALHAQAA